MRSNPAIPSFPLTLLVGLFVAGLVISNIIAVKLFAFGPLALPAAVIVFPVTYIIGDVVTEVYGYRVARRMIWTGFAGNLLAVLAAAAGGLLPPAPFWKGQAAYQEILSFAPRLLLASFTAYLVGEFANAAILARMKVRTRGRWMLPRFWVSTVVGETLDSAVFLTMAFLGVVPPGALLAMIPTHSGAKILYELLASPLSAALAQALKRWEGVDVFDVDTSLNPFLVME